MAESLLNLVAQGTRMRRMRLGKEGDPNAWCWDTGELPLEEELLRHAQELVRQEGLNGDEAERVAARLLGPWHRCAVLEAFGCLIPREFHPKYDSRKPKGKICVDDMQVGVCVDAGGWKVDIFEERVLCEVGSGSSGRLSKSVLEFFLIVLRRIAEKLDLPVAVGTHALGSAVDESTNESLLKLKVRTWKSWAWLSEHIGSAKQFLLPVIRDEGKYPRDVVLLVVSAISDGVSLDNAQQFEVRVFDVLGRSGVAEKLVRNVVAVLSTISDMSGVQDAPVMVQESLPACSCAFDRGFLVLGMLLVFLARSAGKKFHESAETEAGNPVFAAKVRKSLAALFASLRSEADRSGSRDVLLQLKNKAECVQRLELLCAAQVVDDESVLPRSTAPSGTSKSAREIAVSDFQPLKVLTWNIAGASKSGSAPESFSMEDKMAAVQQEIVGRWLPDIVALQECVNEFALAGMLNVYDFLGAAAVDDVHRSCGFVHVYVRRGVQASRLKTPQGVPAVLVRIKVGKESVNVAAVHLMPGPSGAKRRLAQMKAVAQPFQPSGVHLVVGDMNVRQEEMEELLKVGSFRDAAYEGRSFYPAQSRYDLVKLPEIGQGVGYAFDRVLHSSGLHAEAFLVGKPRVFSEGIKFSLSDHSGLLTCTAVMQRVPVTCGEIGGMP